MDEALVLKVIAEQLRVPEESLTPETTFAAPRNTAAKCLCCKTNASIVATNSNIF